MMHRIGIIADRRLARATPAIAKPKPRSTVWASAVTPTPSTTARMACPASGKSTLQ